MKKIFSIFTVLVLVLITMVTPVHITKAASDEIKVIINGEVQSFSQAPVIVNKNTMVPMRDIFEKLGATINWDAKERAVTAGKGTTQIYIKLGESTAKVNGQAVQLAQPALIVQKKTMVPLRFVSEALSANVSWDGKTRTITIDTQNATAKELLLEGLAEEGMTLEDFEFSLLGTDIDLAMKINNLIALMWQNELSVTATNESVRFYEKLQRGNNQDFDVVTAGWSSDYNDPLTWFEVFETDSKNSFGKWSNAKYDQLMELARNEVDNEKRLNYFLEAEKILIEDEAGIIPLYYRNYGYLLNPVFDGVIENTNSVLEFKWGTAKEDISFTKLGDTMPQLDTKILDYGSMEVLNAVYEGLVRVGPNGIEPGIAESWEISEDGKTYTFHLRRDAKWSNGATLNAQDFVDGWERMLDLWDNKPFNSEQDDLEEYIQHYMLNIEDNYSYLTDYIGGADQYLRYSMYKGLNDIYQNQEDVYQQYFSDMYGNVITPDVLVGEENTIRTTMDDVGIKAIDNYTIEIELVKNTPWFLDLLTKPAYMPLQRDFYDTNIADYGSNENTALYNGPWKISEWYDEEGFVLTKNEHYWDAENVDLDKIRYHLMSVSLEEAFSLYDEGMIDYVKWSTLLEMNEMKHRSDYHSGKEGVTFYLEFNTTVKPFNNVKVRKALEMAIDQQEISETIFNNLNDPAYGLVPEGFQAYTTTQKTFREASKSKFGRIIGR